MTERSLTSAVLAGAFVLVMLVSIAIDAAVARRRARRRREGDVGSER